MNKLCGFFSIATAEMLLWNYEPGLKLLDTTLMRNHLKNCVYNGNIQPFPECGPIRHNLPAQKQSYDMIDSLQSVTVVLSKKT